MMENFIIIFLLLDGYNLNKGLTKEERIRYFYFFCKGVLDNKSKIPDDHLFKVIQKEIKEIEEMKD